LVRTIKINKISAAFALLLIWAGPVYCGDDAACPAGIFPAPKSCITAGGQAAIDSNWELVYDRSADNRSAGKYLENVLGEKYGMAIGFSDDKDGKEIIVLNIDRLLDGEIGGEGYLLEVAPDKVTIYAAGEAGLFYGVQTLLQSIEKSDNGTLYVKCIKVMDHPSYGIRGVHINAANYDSLKSQIDIMAGLKMNFAIIESWDFYGLEDPDRKGKMAEIFEYARNRFIEPVPNLVSFSYSGPVVSRYPQAIEGIWVKDEAFVFRGDRASPRIQTAHTLVNVIRDDTTDIVVKDAKGSVTYKEGTDYTVEGGTLQYPFELKGDPAAIKRLPSGRIRDGDTVLVSYDYAEQKTVSWAQWTCTYCPSSPHTYEVMSDAIARVIDALEPRYICLGHDEVLGINRDSRCRKRNMTNEQLFAEDINELYDIIKSRSTDTKVLIWDDMLNPWHLGGNGDIQIQFGGVKGKTTGVIDDIPQDIILLSWWFEANDRYGKMARSPDYFDSKDFDYIEAGWKDRGGIDGLAKASQGHAHCLGIITTTWDGWDKNIDGIRHTAETGW